MRVRMPTKEPTSSVERSIDEAFEIGRAIIADPSLLDDIPNGATLVLLPDDDPGRAAERKALGLAALERGESVYFKRVSHLPL